MENLAATKAIAKTYQVNCYAAAIAIISALLELQNLQYGCLMLK
jgi:hypothetical protein